MQGLCNPMDVTTRSRVTALEQKLSALTGELAQVRNDMRLMKMAADIADLSRRKRKQRLVLFFGRDQLKAAHFGKARGRSSFVSRYRG